LALFYYWNWREDTLSPQLAILRRLKAVKPTVAILGASADRAKFGNKSVRAHLHQGYEVFPVNPKGGEIEGRKVYASLAEIPFPLTRISVYLPPPIALKAMDEIAAKGCEELFLNPGSDADEVVARAQELGLDPIVACSIVDIGENPNELV
jgi:predicted CoA-binding protein